MKLFSLVLLICFAVKSEEIGKVFSSGIIFKDQISIVAFDDPTIKGIACYTTNYEKSMTMSDDATDSSLDCKKVGQITGEFKNLKNIFSQDKTFLSFYKKTVVDRFYDSKRNVLIYISYTKSLGEGKNASHQISVIPLN